MLTGTEVALPCRMSATIMTYERSARRSAGGLPRLRSVSEQLDRAFDSLAQPGSQLQHDLTEAATPRQRALARHVGAGQDCPAGARAQCPGIVLECNPPRSNCGRTPVGGTLSTVLHRRSVRGFVRLRQSHLRPRREGGGQRIAVVSAQARKPVRPLGSKRCWPLHELPCIRCDSV